MSGWRRRRTKRVAPSPFTGPATAPPISQPEGSEPRSAPEQLELPGVQKNDDQGTDDEQGEPPARGEPPVASGEPPTDRDAPLAPDPLAVFELPSEVDEPMPELQLPVVVARASESELPVDEAVAPQSELAAESTREFESRLTAESSREAESELRADRSSESEPTAAPTAESPAEEPEPAPPAELPPLAPEPAATVIAGAAEPEPAEPFEQPPVSPATHVPSAADDAPSPAIESPPPRPSSMRAPAQGVERRAERVVHSPLAGPRRRSARDLQLDLEAAEREAAAEALSAAGDEEEPVGSGVSLEPVIPVTGLAQAALSPAEIEAATRVAIEQQAGRSARVETCPFLRSIAGGTLQPPRDTIDGRNRCAAFGEPLPLSRMQQGLVCLQPAHTTCPRYVRGAMLIQQRIAPAVQPAGQLPVLIASALLLLAVIAVAAYLLLGGRLEPQPGLVPSTGSPSLAAASPTPSPEPQPSPSPTATPSATPRPTPRPTPLPAQYRGLQRCPAPQTCYVYIDRRGDTLEAIARRFNTTVPVLRRLNPQIRGDYLRVGQKVRVPPP